MNNLLDDLVAHFRRFIAMPDPEDYRLLALWTVATHLADELYTTARLLIDSTMPGSGKTTVLEHLTETMQAVEPETEATSCSSEETQHPFAGMPGATCYVHEA